MTISVATIRLPDLIQPALSRPVAGGGTKVYCGKSEFVEGDGFTATAEVEFELVRTSTFMVDIVWSSAEAGVRSWGLSGGPPGQAVASPEPGLAGCTHITTAATRDAGMVTVSANMVTPSIPGSIEILVVVGSDTDDDCVTYAQEG